MIKQKKAKILKEMLKFLLKELLKFLLKKMRNFYNNNGLWKRKGKRTRKSRTSINKIGDKNL